MKIEYVKVNVSLLSSQNYFMNGLSEFVNCIYGTIIRGKPKYAVHPWYLVCNVFNLMLSRRAMGNLLVQ